MFMICKESQSNYLYYSFERNPNIKTKEQIIDFIEKQKVAFIASVDNDGFPNIKAMLMPRKIDGIAFISLQTHPPCA